jgi:hypothetical protein
MHTLPNGEQVKFTIRDKFIDGEIFYYANLVDTNLESYQNEPDSQKETFYGMEMKDLNFDTIYYRDSERLINDILEKYGHVVLISEK